VIGKLDQKPVVMGHLTGGLLAQMLAGRGLSAATVAIDLGVFRGVLPLPASVLKGVGQFLVDPRTRGRAIPLFRVAVNVEVVAEAPLLTRPSVTGGTTPTSTSWPRAPVERQPICSASPTRSPSGLRM
jgi:hypothetical protein